MKTAVVTGANGLLGKEIVEKLSKEGYIIYCIDIKFDKELIDNSADNKILIECDMDNIGDLEINISPDLFYHLAWEGVSTKYKNYHSIQIRNLKYSIDCFAFANQIRSKKFVFLGSASEYAYSDKAIDGKSVVPAPCDEYSAVKACAHIYLQLLAKQHGLPYVRVILPSIYGGKRADANIITYTIQELLNKRKPAFTKLEQLWEYVYIDDAINALYKIGEKGISGRSYPVGWNRSRKLAEYIYIIRDIIDPKLDLGVGEKPYKTGRVDNCIMDTSITIEDIDFEPQIPFEEGIRKTIDFIRKNL